MGGNHSSLSLRQPILRTSKRYDFVRGCRVVVIQVFYPGSVSVSRPNLSLRSRGDSSPRWCGDNCVEVSVDFDGFRRVLIQVFEAEYEEVLDLNSMDFGSCD